MDRDDDKRGKRSNVFTKEVIDELVVKLLQWQENITVMDLSNRKMATLQESMKFPPNLQSLNLSHNDLTEVPSAVLEIKNLKTLDISYNKINYFNEVPAFCHTIEQFNIASNQLLGPPHWVWSECPKQLYKLNLSCNIKITNALRNDYFIGLLQCVTLVTDLDIHNCRLMNFVEIFSTFPKVKILTLGHAQYSPSSANFIEDLPQRGFEDCLELETLDVSNSHIYNLKQNIDIYVNLREINLSQNYLSSLPNEFCSLVKLETCILSYNKLLYLPDDISKLERLEIFCVDCNELCMVPSSIADLHNLKTLDLYDNQIGEVPESLMNVPEVDLAQNYFDEPDNEDYLEHRQKLRTNIKGRYNGRKAEVRKPDSEHSNDTTDDEELLAFLSRNQCEQGTSRPLSSPEDWDSDEYWIPQYYRRETPPPFSPWIYFVKRKLDEGNFCPIDTHMIPIAEQVKYNKLLNPPVEHESDGQFDDYSDDDSSFVL